MKKILFLMIVTAFVMVGCIKEKSGGKEEGTVDVPDSSAAAETTWDYFLIGTWKYAESVPEGKKGTAYPKGVETFSGNGDYQCLTQTGGGEKVIILGTWKLDDQDAYTIWVTQTSIKTASGKSKEGKSKRKYTVLSLDTGKQLIYRIDDSVRTAEWLGR